MKLTFLTAFLVAPITIYLLEGMMFYLLTTNDGISGMAILYGVSAILVMQVTLIIFYDRIFVKQVFKKWTPLAAPQ